MTPDLERTVVEIKQVIEEITSLPVAELRDHDSISEILAADSLSRLEFKIALEARFGIDLESSDWRERDTISSTAVYVSRLVSERDKNRT